MKNKGRKYADPIGVAQYDPFVAIVRVEAVAELFARVVSTEQDSEPKKQPPRVRGKSPRRSRRRK